MKWHEHDMERLTLCDQNGKAVALFKDEGDMRDTLHAVNSHEAFNELIDQLANTPLEEKTDVFKLVFLSNMAKRARALLDANTSITPIDPNSDHLMEGAELEDELEIDITPEELREMDHYRMTQEEFDRECRLSVPKEEW